MSLTVNDVLAVSEQLWPRSGAEQWDTPGLQVGRLSSPVRRILLAVDAVRDTVDEAVQGSFDLLLTHHPLLLRGVTSVREDTYKGSLIGDLVRADIALLAAHTNADVVESGVSDVLAQLLGLQNVLAIEQSVSSSVGIGRVGDLASETTLGDLATRLARLLPPTAPGIAVAGEYSRVIRKVALCGGAGDSLLDHALVTSADVFITSDLRHHRASESLEQSSVTGGPALINVSHWASEWMWLTPAAAQLRELLPGVIVEVSDLRTDPWDFVVTQ